MNSNEDTNLEDLFNTYHQQIYHFIFRYTQDENMSYDIVQDTFIKYQKYQAQFDASKSHIRTFLFRIAYQITMNKLKRQNKLQKLLPFLYETKQESSISLEEKITIKAALLKLPLEQRSVIIFYYYHDFSQKEIAEILQIPLGTVKSRLHAALGKLKKILEVADNE
ncbi:RNA polymerase sigma factor [Gracilibacillus massiliensis]|uniref:RNA polymerase sigma factor n=1 Tax=Gracilibacillus massiliensis TaxID=1564956 RepID=UPI00071DB04C|nr:RNA polymerase sigma factor [Gracilibacillus massiliensis]